MSTDIAQVVDGTITVVSEDVNMRMISNPIPPKSFSYPPKDFFDKQAKNGNKKRSCKREWLTKYPFVSYSRRTVLFMSYFLSYKRTSRTKSSKPHYSPIKKLAEGFGRSRQTCNTFLSPYLYDKNAVIFANHGNSFFKD